MRLFFDVDVKKSFCWHSNLSDDNVISAYAKSEKGYGFQSPDLKTGVENDNFLV